MSVVYKVKDNITKDDFLANGYENITPEMLGVIEVDEEVIYKLIPQRKSSEPVRYAIAMFNHPEWQEFNLQNGGEDYFELLGITFENTFIDEKCSWAKRVVENKSLFSTLKNWRIEINFTEKEQLWLGFTVLDASFPKTFYAKECLDKYCGKEIKRLLSLGLIEEFEVNQ